MPPTAEPLNDHLFLFLHLPKCAGTSLLKMFSEVGRRRCVTVAENENKLAAFESVQRQMKASWIRPSRLKLIQGRNVLRGMERFAPAKQPFFFTFVREPVERFVSQFAFYEVLADTPNHPGHAMAVARIGEGHDRLSLEQFVEQCQGVNMMTRAIASAWLTPDEEPSWWHAPKSGCFAPAKQMLGQMSFIGLVEDFATHARMVCQWMGIRPKDVRLNQSKPLDISNDLRKKIRELVVDDLEIYEFAKQRSGRRLQP